MPDSLRPKIKICGICRVEDAELAVKYGADYIGLIFVKSSPRYIDPIIARPIVEAVGKRAKVVGVFQNATAEEIENISILVGLDYFQLHGQESPSFCSTLSKPTIKAFQLASYIDTNEACLTLPILDMHNDIDLPNPQSLFMPKTISRLRKPATQAADIESALKVLETYKEHCHAFLFDRPKANPNHDWLGSACQTLKLIENQLGEYFFAGGLKTNNVSKVLQTLKPAALDVSSGVETTQRQKSEDLIKDFCAKVRATEKLNNESLIRKL